MDTRELWFLLVANPDGYQYSFDTVAAGWFISTRDDRKADLTYAASCALIWASVGLVSAEPSGNTIVGTV